MSGGGPARLPATVIGGWLGAGKTTLVNHLLRHAGGRRIAVLVNDFGEVSIDADLIEGAEGGVLSLAGGCMCCSWGEDLFGTLARVRDRQPAPDVLLVETSGVAQPATVARLLRLAPDLDVEGVVVLVDAETVRERAADRYVGELVRQQLAEADLLLLNKLDLVTPGQAVEVMQWLGAQVPGVRVVPAEQGRVEPGVVLGVGLELASESGSGSGSRSVSESGSDSDSGPGPGPGSGSSSADAEWPAAGSAVEAPSQGAWQPRAWQPLARDAGTRFESGSQRHDGPVDVAALARELCAPGSRIVRAKGVLTNLDGQPVLLQVVGRRAHIGPAPPGAAQVGVLVWIAVR